MEAAGVGGAGVPPAGMVGLGAAAGMAAAAAAAAGVGAAGLVRGRGAPPHMELGYTYLRPNKAVPRLTPSPEPGARGQGGTGGGGGGGGLRYRWLRDGLLVLLPRSIRRNAEVMGLLASARGLLEAGSVLGFGGARGGEVVRGRGRGGAGSGTPGSPAKGAGGSRVVMRMRATEDDEGPAE
jgi:hypothetical protein